MNKKFFLWLVIGVIMVAPIGSTGTPDYNRSLSSNPTVQSYEQGEDTTRLLMGGGANSRSGRWMWATGFESGLGEVYTQAANGGTVTLTQNVVYMGKNSARIATTAVINSQGLVLKSLFSPSQPNAISNKIGMEIMIEFTLFNGPCRLDFVIVAPNSSLTRYANYRMRINIVNNNNIFIQYQNNAGVYVNFVNLSTYGLAGNNLVYHYMKLVIDANQQRYDRLIFDNTSYDMTTLTPQVVVAFVPTISGQILFENLSNAVTPSVQLDNLILTGDEP